MRRNVGQALAGLLGTALLVLGGFLAPATAAMGAEADASMTWGVSTGGNSNPPRDNFTLEAEPGETLTDSMLVSNHGTAPLTLAIYAADGFTTADGQLDVLTADKTSEGVGAWVEFAAPAITLGPDETTEVPFTVTVPENAEPGDYAGAVLTSLSSTGGGGFSVDRRLGVRVYLRVAGELAPSMTIGNAQVEYHGTPNPVGLGTSVVSFTVTNTGNARLNASHHVTVSGPGGILGVAATADDIPQLLPGESWTTELVVDGVAPTFVATADISVVPTLPDGTELGPVTATASVGAMPWTLLGVLAVLAGLLLWWIARRRRARTSGKTDSAGGKGGSSSESIDGRGAVVEREAIESAGRVHESGITVGSSGAS